MDKETQITNTPTLPQISKDMEGLRDALFDEINLIRANKVPVSHGRVVANLAKRVIESVTLDLFAQGLLGEGNQTPDDLKRLNTKN